MTACCPLCNETEVKNYLETDGIHLVQCRTCGLVRVEGHAGKATSYDGDEYFVEKNHYIENWDLFCQLFDTLLDKISIYKGKGTFLDVGCGVGCLVSRALERGFIAQGVEISDWAAAFARQKTGTDVVSGTLADAAYDSATFDIVVINHVLEHVPDPVAVLNEARRVLKDDGLLVVGVPNFGSIMARLAGARWSSLRPDEHRWHFTPGTLRKLVSRCGLREVYFESKENHLPGGWTFKDIILRLIIKIAVATGRSEAMLLFCVKS